MEMGRLLNGVMTFCKWVTHFAVLNLMWIGCTFLGGVIFGIAPSTVAMYVISRKAAEGEGEIHVVRLFWHTFRKEFFRANGLAGVLTVFGLLWYFDMHFFRQFEGGIYTVMNYFMMMLGLVHIILLMYILPVYVHYDLKLFQYFKQALMIAFLRPRNLILMLVCVLSTYYFFISFPGFIPIFGFTIFAHLNMWLAFKCFESIEEVRVDMT